MSIIESTEGIDLTLMTIIALIIGSIVLCLIIIFWIYEMISSKIHNSYHKGYNECRNDEILYYKSLRDLDNSFKEILKTIKSEGLKLSFNTTQEVLSYSKLIKKFREKY